jgi:spore germination protein GerM
MIRARARARARAGAALAFALLGTAAACGIPADDGPRAISEQQIPDEGSVDTGDTSEGRTVRADLYFASDIGTLVTVRREVPSGGSATTPTPSTVLENLLAGTDPERDEPVGDPGDIVSQIPPDTRLATRPELEGGILTVDLNGAINGVQGEGARLAYGQMVCTADALDEVDGVRFTIDGEPVNAPTDTQNSSDPVTCDSYANLRTPRPG